MVRALPLLNAHFMGTNMRTYKQISALSDRVSLINRIDAERIAKQKFVNRIGYVGLCFVQGAIFPNLIWDLGWIMHLSLLLGLCCYQYRNLHDTNDKNRKLYTWGNCTGITLNTLMLIKLGVL